MSMTGPNPGPQPLISNPQLALIVYILYLAAYVVGITAVIGVIIAHVQVGTAEPVLASHYRFQIRTFWIGLLYLVVGGILRLGADRLPGAAVVVHLVAGAQHQGHSGAEREPADRRSGLVDVRMTAAPV